MTKLKILICGGGVAGNAVAFWLSSAGHDITIIERWPELRSSGLQIDLRGFGIEVLKRMGLESTFRDVAVREDGIRFVDKSGKVRGFFGANRSGEGKQSFSSDFEIMRGDLVNILYQRIKDKVTYRFETTISAIMQTDKSVKVSFSDGSKDAFDLLIGADGQSSRTRKMMLGPNAQDPIKLLEHSMAYFTTPQPMPGSEKYTATFYLAPNSRTITFRRHTDDQTQIYLGCKSRNGALKNVKKGDMEKEKEAFIEIYRDAGWQDNSVLKAIEASSDFYCERPGVVTVDPWFDRRVVLVGDAAYCPTLNTGMGTTSSVVGAYVLAGEIQKFCHGSNAGSDISAALAAYDRKFRPFMSQVQKGVAEKDWMKKLPTNSVGIFIFNIVIGLMSFFKYDIVNAISEEVKDWELPEYECSQSEKSKEA